MADLPNDSVDLSMNSAEYWDKRFQEDWDAKEGREQSRFFSRIAIQLFPQWFVQRVKSEKLNICDWGCAEGDGTQVLAEFFTESKLTGVDIAESAIQKAKTFYQNIDFSCSDFLATPGVHEFSVVFSSNTLEHFHEPWEVFDKVATHARDFVVLLIPFREYDRFIEHFTTFDFGSIQLNRGEWTLLHSRALDAKTITPNHWQFEQILLIFTRTSLIPQLHLSLADITLYSESNAVYLHQAKTKILEERIAKNAAHIKELTKQLESSIVLEAEIGSLKNEIKHAEEQSRRLIKELKIVNEQRTFELTDAKRQIERLQELLREETSEKNSYVAQLAVTKHENASLNSQLYQFLNSKRWIRATQLSNLFHKLLPDRSPQRTLLQMSLACIKFLRHPWAYVIPAARRVSIYGNFLGYHLISLPKNTKTIALQVESFDKGGLEEVVYSLAIDAALRERYNVVVLVANEAKGYFATKAKRKKVLVLGLYNNQRILAYLIKKLRISVCNLHYSLFGVEQYASAQVKTIYTVHNNYIWADEAFVAYRKAKYALIDSFIAVSLQVKEYFSRKYTVPSSKITVIPNGVNAAALDVYTAVTREQWGLTKNDFVLVNVARFTPSKLQVSLIVAVARVIKTHPEVKLIMVGNKGDENYYHTVKDMVRKYGVEKHVQIIDFLPRAEVLGLMKIADCFVLPSLSEGFSISALEAMYCELPLILTDIGGAREVIQNEDIGILIKPPYENIQDIDLTSVCCHFSEDKNLTNTGDLVKAITTIANNPKRWHEKARLGKQKVVEYFTLSRVVTDYCRAYEEVLIPKAETRHEVVSEPQPEIVVDPDTRRLFPNAPLVSIMLPIYNHAEYAEQSIESVLQQTYQNWELIIIDDGSTDHLLDLLEKYATDKRIRIYTQKNQKLPRTLTHLHGLAQGDLLTWTSADNIMEPTMIETLVSFMEKHPDCVLSYADVSIIDKDGNLMYGDGYRDNERDPERPYIIRLPRDARPLGAEADNYINACFMYRKEAAAALQGTYAADLTGLEDYDFWLRLSRAGAIQHIENEEPLYRYRVHKKTMSEELLTVKRDQHFARLAKFIPFEQQRAQLAEEDFSIQVLPHTFGNLTSVQRNARKKVLFYSNNEKPQIELNTISIEVTPTTYFITVSENNRIPVSRGYDCNPLSIKARFHEKDRVHSEFSQAKGRAVVGIHMDLSLVDVEKTRNFMTHSPHAFFVICSTSSDENACGQKLAEGIENCVFVGTQPLGAPYKLYASWRYLFVPPLLSGESFITESQATLAWNLRIPLLYNSSEQSFSHFPLCFSYETELVLPHISVTSEMCSVLERYINEYSTKGRLARVLQLCTTILQDRIVKRPDFGAVEGTEELPTQVLYSQNTNRGKKKADFSSEIAYWDTELSLKGAYPMAIKNRSTPELMHKEYPVFFEQYRVKLPGKKVRVLDVGSGPLSMLAYGYYQKFYDLDCVDPLGDEYQKLLKKYNFTIDYRMLCCPGEELAKKLKKDSYDIVWMHNALDHSQNPEKVVQQMAKLVKPGGYLLIAGWEDEGKAEQYIGLHQNDLSLKGKHLMLSVHGKKAERIDVIPGLKVVEAKREFRGRWWLQIAYQKQ